MKNLIITILAVAASLTAFAKPTISLDSLSHDFGNIREIDGPVNYKFKFTNTGDDPLVIITVSADCGCTKPKFPARPIEPGKTEEISVTFNPAGYRGEFTKSIKVRTNDNKNKTVKLKISGVVIPGKE